MHFVDFMQANGHQELAVWTDPAVGLTAFIAIHDTTLGPALGGTRIWPYPSNAEAIMDVLRLSKAMTYKSAAAGLPMGGPKGVIVADPHRDKTEAMFRSYGCFVESLGGRYITTEDVGASAREMEWISHETKHVVGLPESMGGGGNPASVTGYGIFQAMRACAVAMWGSDTLRGKTVAIQGFGNVATALTTYLLKTGTKVIVTDIFAGARARALETKGVEVVEPDAIYDVAADIFAPCGAANNQLGDDSDAGRMQERGILWAPDYIVNAGGVINVFYEFGRTYNREAAMAKASEIFDTTIRVIETSREQGVTTLTAADGFAEQRIQDARSAGNR